MKTHQKECEFLKTSNMAKLSLGRIQPMEEWTEKDVKEERLQT